MNIKGASVKKAISPDIRIFLDEPRNYKYLKDCLDAVKKVFPRRPVTVELGASQGNTRVTVQNKQAKNPRRSGSLKVPTSSDVANFRSVIAGWFKSIANWCNKNTKMVLHIIIKVLFDFITGKFGM